jgi:hypothetical protein
MSAATRRPEVTEALSTLDAYLRGALSLDELIEWAERLGAEPAEDAWLQRVSSDLANPLLCREQATALIHEHLRARAAAEGAHR